MAERARLALRIEGKVQGVYFRASAREEAQRLGLTGWVRNEDDGSVSAEAQGRPDPLQAFVAWCHKGPSAATVTAVRTEPRPLREDESGFDVEPRP
ncbi:MAG TPA: acylphosphatase [Myxococcaceae bacterium]|nr:acylphosphatase [Myxococcaceae bacterium]